MNESVENIYNKIHSGYTVECKIRHIRVHTSILHDCVIASNHVNDQWLIRNAEELEELLEREGLVLL